MPAAAKSVPPLPAPLDLKAALLDHARALGFDAVNVTSPDAIGPAGDRLMTFLSDGRHGDMDWLETTAARRRDPRVLWPEVRSIIMLGMSYAPQSDPMDGLRQTSQGHRFGLCAGERLSRRRQGQAEAAGAMAARGVGAGREGIRRHGAADGEAAGASGRARLAGQAHEPGVAHAWVLVVSGRHREHGRA